MLFGLIRSFFEFALHRVKHRFQITTPFPGSPNSWTDSHVLLSAWESVAAMRSGEMRRTALSRKPHPPPSDDAPAQPRRGDCREFLDLRVAGAMPTQIQQASESATLEVPVALPQSRI